MMYSALYFLYKILIDYIVLALHEIRSVNIFSLNPLNSRNELFREISLGKIFRLEIHREEFVIKVKIQSIREHFIHRILPPVK